MAYYGDPASALAAQLRQLEEENVRLRNELMDAADEKFNLQATMATIEAEAQHKASQQVVGLQSELNFKKVEVEQQRLEVAKLMKEVQELRQKAALSEEAASRFASSSSSSVVASTASRAEASVAAGEPPSATAKGAAAAVRPASAPQQPQQSTQNAALLLFLPTIHRAMEEVLLSCAYGTSVTGSLAAVSAGTPGGTAVHTPTMTMTTSRRALLSSGGGAGGASVPSSQAAAAPFQRLIDELAALLRQCQSSAPTAAAIDPMPLLRAVSAGFAAVVTATLPFASSRTSAVVAAASSSSSSSATAAAAAAAAVASSSTLPVLTLIRYLQLMRVLVEQFPWRQATLLDLAHGRSAASTTATTTAHRPAAADDAKGPSGGGGLLDDDDDEDDEDGDVFVRRSRVRSNLSQHFDRLKRSASVPSAGVGAATPMRTLLGGEGKAAPTASTTATATATATATSSSSHNHRDATDAYVRVAMQALQRVQLSTAGRSAAPSTATSSGGIKPLAFRDVGLWVETVLDTVHDLCCRHAVLFESLFEYRHASFQGLFADALLQTVAALVAFYRRHVHHRHLAAPSTASAASSSAASSLTAAETEEDTGRYLTTLFDRLSISRVAYHQALYDARVGAGWPLGGGGGGGGGGGARGGRSLATVGYSSGGGGSQALSPRLFSVLSSTSMATWLFQAAQLAAGGDRAASTATWLPLLTWLLHDRACFTAFMRQQTHLLRLWQRQGLDGDVTYTAATAAVGGAHGGVDHRLRTTTTASSATAAAAAAAAPLAATASVTKCLPLVLFLVQEACRLDGVVAVAGGAAGGAAVATMATTATASSAMATVPSSPSKAATVLRYSQMNDSLGDGSVAAAASSSLVDHDDVDRRHSDGGGGGSGGGVLVLQATVLQRKATVLRWLLGLAKYQPQSFVALLLQVVPPQSLSPEDAAAVSTGDGDGDGDGNGDDDGDGGRLTRSSDGDDGLARSAMTVVAVRDRDRGRGGGGGGGGSRRSSTASSQSQATATAKRKRRRGAKQMLADILEESSDADDGDNDGDDRQRMDVDDDGSAAAAAAARTADDFSWPRFQVTSLQFDVATTTTTTAAATIPLFLPPTVVDTRRGGVGGGASPATTAPSTSAPPTRVSAVQGAVYAAATAKRAAAAVAAARATLFDTSHLLGLYRLWMQLWRWCDLLPVPRATWPPPTASAAAVGDELHADQLLLLEMTRDCTRLLNAVVGVLRHHPQCRLLLRDGSGSIVTSFFFRDTLHCMHPSLRLSRKDYDQLEALEE